MSVQTLGGLTNTITLTDIDTFQAISAVFVQPEITTKSQLDFLHAEIKHEGRNKS